MSKLNLEEMAEVSDTKEETKTEKEESKESSEKKNKKDTSTELDNMFKLPFTVAMQNLKLSKDFVLELGEQLLTEGEIHFKIELPKGNYIILTTRKASEELDFYTFLAESLQRELTEQEFNYMLRIRNLAVIIEEVKFGEFQENFKDKDPDYKFNKLFSLSNIAVNLMLSKSVDFQSALLLLMHPKAIDFLTSSLQG